MNPDDAFTVKTPRPHRSRTVVLDFDGVLHHMTTGWHLRPDVGDDPVPHDIPVPGAVAFCQWLVESGYQAVIHSARLHAGGYMSGATPMREWLYKNGFPDMPIAVTKPQDAFLFVDDKGFRFEGDFAAVRCFIEGLESKPDSWAKVAWGARRTVVFDDVNDRESGC